MNPPAAGTEVTLQVPQRERVAAKVSGAGKGWLELGLLESARTPMAQLERMRMFVEYVNDDGVCRLLGALEKPEPGGRVQSADYGVIDTVRFAFTHSPQLLQRREFIRTDFVADITLCRLSSTNAIAIAGKTVNVSGGGVLVGGLASATVGDLYTFELALFKGEAPISGTCRVMRITGDGLAGMMFTEVDPVEQDRILRWAFGIGRAEKDTRDA